MNYELTTGIVAEEGRNVFETLDNLKVAILGEAFLYVKGPESEAQFTSGEIEEMREHVIREIRHIIRQIPLDDLSDYVKVLLFRDIGYTFSMTLENIKGGVAE